MIRRKVIVTKTWAVSLDGGDAIHLTQEDGYGKVKVEFISGGRVFLTREQLSQLFTALTEVWWSVKEDQNGTEK